MFVDLTIQKRVELVLRSQGRPITEATLFDECEQERLAECCDCDGCVCVTTPQVYAEVVTSRNIRLESLKASAEEE